MVQTADEFVVTTKLSSCQTSQTKISYTYLYKQFNSLNSEH